MKNRNNNQWTHAPAMKKSYNGEYGIGTPTMSCSCPCQINVSIRDVTSKCDNSYRNISAKESLFSLRCTFGWLPLPLRLAALLGAGIECSNGF